MEHLSMLGIAGSLRQDSYNWATLRAACTLAPPEVTLDAMRPEGIPLYNQDHEHDLPPAVVSLKERIRAADAILFVTPEYNYSIPGVLKNAIDWASRPYGENAWAGKPAAIMGASIGALGTARAQYHLRQCLVFLDMHPLNQPEVFIGDAQHRFDDKGHLVDAHSRERVSTLLARLAQWTRLLRSTTPNR